MLIPVFAWFWLRGFGPKPHPERFANVSLSYHVTVQDRGGTVVHEEEGPSHSFVAAFLAQLLAALTQQTLAANHNDTGGTGRALRGTTSAGTTSIEPFTASGAVTVVTRGIVAGTGTAAVTTSDSKLGTLIAHGTSAGQLSYNAQQWQTDVTTATPDVYFITTRTLYNLSGGNVSVGEVGIYGDGFYTGGGSTAATLCFVRDVPSLAVVPDGGLITIEYKFKTTA